MFLADMHPDIVALDAGSSGCRAARFSSSGQIICSSEEIYGRETDESLDPQQVLQAVESVLARCDWRSGLLSPGSIMHSLLRLDGKGKPHGGCTLWSDRSARLNDLEHIWLPGNGCPPGAHIPLYRLLARPESYRGYRLVSLKNYILSELLGISAPEDWTTAAASGCLDIGSRRWKLPDQLQDFLPFFPEVVSPLTDLGGSLAGSSDGALAHLGSCGSQRKAISLTMGTTTAVRLIAGRSEPQSGQFQYPLWGEDFLHGMASNHAGYRLSSEEIKSLQVLPAQALLERRGSFFDLSTFEDRARYVRPLKAKDETLSGKLEAMAFLAVALCEELARSRAIQPERIVLSGSLALAPAIVELMARITPFPLFLADRRAGLYGSFFLARLALKEESFLFPEQRVQVVRTMEINRFETWKREAFLSMNAEEEHCRPKV
ncbi:MAG: hypothetical protein HS115_07585 [Spirochaetales bacterium]|nr:hypothetical protein [Spirochaetales bacterium]